MGERLTIELDDATIATVRRAGVSHEQLEVVAVQAIRRLVVRDAVAALERWHQAHPDYAQLADREYEVSQRRESHPPLLLEPGVTVSRHRAPTVEPVGI